MKRLFFLVFLVFIFGCAATPHIPTYHYTSKEMYNGKPKVIWVWIDNNFDTFEKISISEALWTWNNSLNGYIELRPILPYGQPDRPEMPSDKDWVISKVKPGDNHLPAVEAGHKVLGAADMVGGHNMFLAPGAMEISDVYYVTLHEVGHLLGAEHRGEKLMFPHFNKVKFHCTDYLTVQQIADYQNIPVRNLNYCTKY